MFKLLQDAPWPEKAISWPQSRRLEDYLRLLLSPWTFKALSESPQLPDIMALLSLAWLGNQPAALIEPKDFLQGINPDNKPIVVDIGMGDAYALREMKEKEGFITVGLGLHEVNPENAPFIDLLCYSPVPNGDSAQRVFQALRGKVALVCEAFGATTYAAGESNPIEALIYEGLLLAPGGTAKIIVSGIPKEDEELSPIGFALQRKRLIEFFKEELGLSLKISRTYIKSLLMPGPSVDYHIEIYRAPHAMVSLLSLDELFAKVQEVIGLCRIIPKSTGVGEFDGFGIRGRTYTRPDEEVQLASLNIVENIKCMVFRFEGEEDSHPAFNLMFESSEVMDDFIQRFSEYYLHTPEKIEWSLTVDEENRKVTVIYIGAYQNRLDAKQQAQIEINRVVSGLIKTDFSNRMFKPMNQDLTSTKSLEPAF